MQIKRFTKYYVLLLLFIIQWTAVFAQSITENYNNGSINQRESDCWVFENFEINQSNPINTPGGEKKHGATVDMDYNGGIINPLTYNSSASMMTPFLFFDGNGKVEFKHKADHDEVYYIDSDLKLYLIDEYGNRSGPYFSHVYKQLFILFVQSNRPNGDPTVTNSESINLPAGYYRILWEWSDFSSWTEFFIDDISIDTASTFYTETATVCLNETVLHTPSTAVTGGDPYNFEYTWSWVGTAGGTITEQTSNDRTASIDWNVGAGTYRLKVQETYENGSCNGRTTYIDVTVLDEPTFAIEIDTVCEGFQATMSFEGLVGDAPFTVTYNDGTGSKNFTTTGSSRDVLLDADATSVTITDVEDSNGCHADAALLTAYPVYYHPSPTTNPIYHY